MPKVEVSDRIATLIPFGSYCYHQSGREKPCPFWQMVDSENRRGDCLLMTEKQVKEHDVSLMLWDQVKQCGIKTPYLTDLWTYGTIRLHDAHQQEVYLTYLRWFIRPDFLKISSESYGGMTVYSISIVDWEHWMGVVFSQGWHAAKHHGDVQKMDQLNPFPREGRRVRSNYTYRSCWDNGWELYEAFNGGGSAVKLDDGSQYIMGRTSDQGV